MLSRKSLGTIRLNNVRTVLQGLLADAQGAELRPNNALLTDASTSPLRAQRGAAKRER